MIYRYLLLRFLANVFVTTFLLGFVVCAGTYANFLARFADRASAAELFFMALASIPTTLHQFSMVVMAVASAVTLIQFGRTSEITILKAQGISSFRILNPMMAATLLLGVIDVVVLTAIAGPTSRYLSEKTISLSRGSVETVLQGTRVVEPLLEHQNDGNRSYFVQALRDRDESETLYKVRVFRLSEAFNLDRWYQAEEGRLDGRIIHLPEAIEPSISSLESQNPGTARKQEVKLPTLLGRSRESSLEGLAGTVEFWPLLRIYWLAQSMRQVDLVNLQSLLQKPILLLGLVLFSAALMLPIGRGQSYSLRVCGLTLMVFFLYLLNRILTGLGEIGILGIFTAVWLPAILLLALSLVLLLTTEEG